MDRHRTRNFYNCCKKVTIKIPAACSDQLALEGLSFAVIAPVNLDFEFLPHAFLQKTPDRIDSVALDRQMYLRST